MGASRGRVLELEHLRLFPLPLAARGRLGRRALPLELQAQTNNTYFRSSTIVTRILLKLWIANGSPPGNNACALCVATTEAF